MAAFGGLILASPFILWQVWRFITPGLRSNEKRYAIPFVTAAVVLFCAGCATAYLIFPHALAFLKAVGGPHLYQLLSPTSYLSLVMWMMVLFGLAFEFPVVLVALELVRVVSPGPAAPLVAVGGDRHHGGGGHLHAELGPVLHAGPGGAPGGLLLRGPSGSGSCSAVDEPRRAAPGGEASVRRRFLADLPFPPDEFQLAAVDSLDAGHSVLVSAPTGSGKTLVAAYGVHRALAQGGKAFYTTPLKALSNQKFAELVAEHGAGRVGLLTGDTAVRPGAPVVVMTTEVLRNMLLAGSDLLAGLRTVVLDEVHYLQDPYRGGVWEEVLVLSPPEVGLRLPVGHGGQRRGAGGVAAVGARRHRRGGRAAPPGRPAPPLRPQPP